MPWRVGTFNFWLTLIQMSCNQKLDALSMFACTIILFHYQEFEGFKVRDGHILMHNGIYEYLILALLSDSYCSIKIYINLGIKDVITTYLT